LETQLLVSAKMSEKGAHDLRIENVSDHSTHDEVAESAKGGDLEDMPKGYYRSWSFLGTLAAVSLMGNGLYLGM
jgi:hypothetical protein